MKQTSFLVEIVLTKDNPTIIIRDPRGAIVKVTRDPQDVAPFLSQTVSYLENPTPDNIPGNE